MQTTIIEILLLGILCLTLYKIRKVHLASFQIEASLKNIETESSQTYRQLQAYLALVQLLEPRQPLPLLRGWAASPDFLLTLAKHALNDRPQTILECSSGASTVVLARCCELNGRGHVYSLEHDPEYAEKSRKLIAEHGLETWSTIIDAPLIHHSQIERSNWYSLEALPKDFPLIDLLVIDGPPGTSAPLARLPALPLLQSYFSPFISIFLDDADREDEKEIVRRWQSMLPNLILERPYTEKGCAILRPQKIKI
ncbi:MAG: class I SAM-dependent methyltransferase [Parazoarcus communis]